MSYTPTMGSLFSGIGGFELPAIWHGAKVLWQSEIEPWAVELLKKQFPDATQLGDISKIDGHDIPPVDFITFGSPCQDMSIAGKRAGLDGERSGLFRQAIRIIQEMREATDGKYPKFAVWENVPGALSSNKGFDFKAVLEEIAEIDIPMPASGRWATAGMVRGGAADISWRVLDAQYWGVPQRRKRIYLVADYRAERTAEILFKPEGVSRYTPPRGEAWQATAADTETGTGAASEPKCYDIGEARRRNPQEYDGLCPAILASWGEGGNNVAAVAYRICSMNSKSMKSDNPNSGIYETDKSATVDTGGGNPACNQGGVILCTPLYILQGNMIGRKDENGPQGDGVSENMCYTLTATDIHGACIPIISFEPGAMSRIGGYNQEDIASTLRANMGDNQLCFCVPCLVYDARGNGDGKTAPTETGDHNNRITDFTAVAVQPIYAIDRAAYNQGKNAQFDISIKDDGKTQTVVARGPNAVGIPIFSFYPQMKAESQCFKADIANTVVNGTSLGFHNGVLVPQCVTINERQYALTVSEDVANTLSATDYKGVQLLGIPVVLRERAGCEGGGKGILLQIDKSGTLGCHNDQSVFIPIGELVYIVRRLTPSEWAKLQGFPADWHEGITNDKGKPMPDTAAYKGYGNAVATVCAEHPIANIIQILKEEDKDVKNE